MKNVKFLFALFMMLLFAAFSGAVLGGLFVVEIINKRKVESIEDILEENFEDEKKKNSSLEGTTKGFSEQSPTTSMMDMLAHLLSIGTAIRNNTMSLDSKHIQIMKVRYTPCNKRFRISHEGCFWIPPEYESDYDCPPKNSEDQHYYIRNLFIDASGRES